MGWAMRYTSHLGYAPPLFRPQFAASVGTADPAAHILYAARMGMTGVLYPWALARPSDEIQRVKQALAETGLTCSCIVGLPPDLISRPVWSDRSKAGRGRLANGIAEAARLATSLGSSVLAVLIASDPQRDDASQRDEVADNLREVAVIAEDHNVTIGVEPMIVRPGMLLRSIRQGFELVQKVSHQSVGLIYDTAHVAMMDGDLLESFRAVMEHIVLIQIADQPGRVEPGAGRLNIAPVLIEAARAGYSGLVDFEHGWLDESLQGEQAGIERLLHFDRLVLSGRHKS